MSPPLAASAEPGATGAGTGLPAELDAPLAAARALAGDTRVALILSGSHASGESVWATDAGRRVSLSDLDLYVVMPDLGARREAERRAQRAPIPRPAGGLAAAIEVGFATRDDLARLPARPGTIELKRHGRVLDGPATALADVPAWEGRDVGREEIERLIENRAYELLWAGSPRARRLRSNAWPAATRCSRPRSISPRSRRSRRGSIRTAPRRGWRGHGRWPGAAIPSRRGTRRWRSAGPRPRPWTPTPSGCAPRPHGSRPGAAWWRTPPGRAIRSTMRAAPHRVPRGAAGCARPSPSARAPAGPLRPACWSVSAGPPPAPRSIA